jgi:hypothetical protein
MSREISVVLKADMAFLATPPNDDVYSPEFEAWEKEALRRHRFSEPLGSEWVVGEYWSRPSLRLGLPLLGSIYDEGFHVAREWRGDDLDALERELAVLVDHWSRQPFESDIADHLAERAGFLREAIRIARSEGGVILIS